MVGRAAIGAWPVSVVFNETPSDVVKRMSWLVVAACAAPAHSSHAPTAIAAMFLIAVRTPAFGRTCGLGVPHGEAAVDDEHGPGDEGRRRQQERERRVRDLLRLAVPA